MRKKGWRPREHHDCANPWELRVYERLQDFLKERRIHEFRHSTKREDAEKIDFVIEVEAGRTLFLQVKRRYGAAKRHCEDWPDIPCILVSDEITDEQLDGKLLRIFERWRRGERGICE